MLKVFLQNVTSIIKGGDDITLTNAWLIKKMNSCTSAPQDHIFLIYHVFLKSSELQLLWFVIGLRLKSSIYSTSLVLEQHPNGHDEGEGNVMTRLEKMQDCQLL